MARGKSSKPGARATGAPWTLLLEIALLLRWRWLWLSPRERERLRGLIRSSRGRPRNLSPRERRQLRRLLVKLRLGRMAGELRGLQRMGSARRACSLRMRRA